MTKAKRQLRMIGYGRVSKMGGRSEADDSTQTLKDQRGKVSAIGTYKGWENVGWFQDLDASGGNTDRPQFQRALEMIEAGEADVFCCAYLSRFSRSLVDTVETERRIREAGGSLFVGDVDIDTSTPTGRLVFTILAAMNQQFLEEKTEQFNGARAAAVERGVAPSRTPLGYRKGADRRYEIVEEEAEIVRLAFQLRADGVACPEIARQLNAEGFRSRKGAQFTDRLVRNLLEVRSYVGDVVDGDYVKRDAHPAIVARDVWAKAQTTTRPRALDTSPSLLAGVVRCASCSYGMQVMGTRADGLLYYRCRRVHGSGRCPAPASISMENLDAFVEREFLETIDNLVQVPGFDTAGDPDVEAEIEAAQLELDTFLDAAEISVLGADRYNREAGKRKARLDRAVEARRRSQRNALPHVGYSEVGGVWPQLSLAARRDVLHASLDAVFVKPAPRSHASSDPADRTYIAPVGTVQVALPRRGVLGVLAPFVFPGDSPPDVTGELAA